MLYSNSLGYVRGMKATLESMWSEATDAKERIAEIEAGGFVKVYTSEEVLKTILESLVKEGKLTKRGRSYHLPSGHIKKESV